MSVAERIRHEVREIGLTTLYFFACFVFFLSLKALLLSQYEIEVEVLGTAFVGALVVAKVAIILDATPLGDWFSQSRVILHVLWRSLAYTLGVFLVTLAEHLFELYRESAGLSEAIERLVAGERFDQVAAMNLSICFFFVVYNVVGEIQRQLGPTTLRDVFFSRRVAT